jgi:serine/threonine protein kinase
MPDDKEKPPKSPEKDTVPAVPRRVPAVVVPPLLRDLGVDDPTVESTFDTMSNRAPPAEHGETLLRIGEVIAQRYRIVRFIAGGGMGEVYEALDGKLNDRIALKMIRARVAENPTSLERFRREIVLARKVTHPNVCRVFDVGSHRVPSPDEAGRTHELAFLTMELLDGETLSQRLKQGPLSLTEALPLLAQMGAALDAAHDAGVIHRDFKSGNVMLVRKGEATRVVVCDFGLARNPSGGAQSLTDSGTIVGTPEYMAPEQMQGDPLTPALDIYAFGVVTYQMLTGRTPFSTKNLVLAAEERQKGPPPAPSTIAPSLPPRCDEVILRCMALAPSARFPRATEAVRALAAASSRRGRWPLVAALVALAAALAYWLGLHSSH